MENFAGEWKAKYVKADASGTKENSMMPTLPSLDSGCTSKACESGSTAQVSCSTVMLTAKGHLSAYRFVLAARFLFL